MVYWNLFTSDPKKDGHWKQLCWIYKRKPDQCHDSVFDIDIMFVLSGLTTI